MAGDVKLVRRGPTLIREFFSLRIPKGDAPLPGTARCGDGTVSATGGKRLHPLAPIAVDRNGFQPRLPRLEIHVSDLLYGDILRHVHGL